MERFSIYLKIAASLGNERWEIGSIMSTLPWWRKLKLLFKTSSLALVYHSKCLATLRLLNFLVITFMFLGIMHGSLIYSYIYDFILMFIIVMTMDIGQNKLKSLLKQMTDASCYMRRE